MADGLLFHHYHYYVFLLLVNMPLIRLVDGAMATLANQGVAETLRINLRGNNAFVIAYAVASLVTPSAINMSQNAMCNTKVDILDNNPGSSFTSSPPPMPPSFALFTQPPLLPEILPKFLNPITDPFPFADEWGHPFRVMKRRS